MTEALVAAAEASWFQNPGFSDDTDERLVFQEPERSDEEPTLGSPLTVLDSGQVYGHLALWGRCHVGYGNTCVRPPKEPSSYKGFLTGSRNGTPTGPVVMGGGHAPLTMAASAAADYYDRTSKAIADVAVGTDTYGIWAAGGLRSTVKAPDVEVLQASALSGDWRPIGGQLRLVSILAVNNPGFRIHRPMALAASGALQTVGPRCLPCASGEPEETLEERVQRLESELWNRVFDGIDA